MRPGRSQLGVDDGRPQRHIVTTNAANDSHEKVANEDHVFKQGMVRGKTRRATTRRDAFDGNPRDRARPEVHVKVAAAMPVRSERCRPPITLGSYLLRPLTFTTMQTARVGLGSALRSAQRMRTSLDGP